MVKIKYCPSPIELFEEYLRIAKENKGKLSEDGKDEFRRHGQYSASFEDLMIFADKVVELGEIVVELKEKSSLEIIALEEILGKESL
jgi:hypothetical protein